MHLRDSRRPGLTRVTTCRVRELTLDHMHTSWPHKDMERLPRWGINSMPKPSPRQHEYARRYTPYTQPVIQTRWIWKDGYDGQLIFGDHVDLKFPDTCLTGEEKPRKNLTQEICPERGTNPGPLRDRRACYRLFHSGGRFEVNIQHFFCASFRTCNL